MSVDVTIGGGFAGEPSNDPIEVQPETATPIAFRDAETNGLSRAESDRAPSFSLDTFATAFDRVRAAQPTLAQTSTEFARALVAELARLAPQATTQALPREIKASEMWDTFQSLNPEEKALVLANPVKAYLSRTATTEARTATEQTFSGSMYLTRADAFRHSYWNWLMSKCCSVGWATAFATAHESSVANDDDKRMDLNNNMIGRRLFTSAPNSTPEAAQAALLNYKLLWVNRIRKNVTVGVDYLVYLEPSQTLTVFDDGPDYDDIYTVSIAGKAVGDTPQGASREFEFDQIPSGDHTLTVNCKLDGTKGGCGFQIRLKGALTLPGGSSNTSQLVIQEGETHSTTFNFPTMNDARTN
ncbi:hypothetical protein ASF45_32015 [Pseudorhodoferax sp. Leaf265]|nr:hypothetical protein ASF45_32015 [Pseudorhodoferax sp. Leaf265]